MDDTELELLAKETSILLQEAVLRQDETGVKVIAQLARLVSHQHSEERWKRRIEKTVEQHQIWLRGDEESLNGEKVGVLQDMRDMKKYMKGNRKLHWVVISTLLAAIITNIWRGLSK